MVSVTLRVAAWASIQPATGVRYSDGGTRGRNILCISVVGRWGTDWKYRMEGPRMDWNCDFIRGLLGGILRASRWVMHIAEV